MSKYFIVILFNTPLVVSRRIDSLIADTDMTLNIERNPPETPLCILFTWKNNSKTKLLKYFLYRNFSSD